MPRRIGGRGGASVNERRGGRAARLHLQFGGERSAPKGPFDAQNGVKWPHETTTPTVIGWASSTSAVVRNASGYGTYAFFGTEILPIAP